MKREFPFPPYPRGWYRVADSADLAPGAVLRLEYFGRPLVAARFGNDEVRSTTRARAPPGHDPTFEKRAEGAGGGRATANGSPFLFS